MKHLVLRIAVLATILAFTASASAQDPGSAGIVGIPDQGGLYLQLRQAGRVAGLSAPGRASRSSSACSGTTSSRRFSTRVVNGKTIDDRPFVVKRLKTREFKDCGCQILFVAAAQSARTDDVIQFQNAASVLTIAEAPEFAKTGGVIAMILEDSKIRFAVNVDAATQASLNISSRLLALASIVQTTR